jgi:hypothetical protein
MKNRLALITTNVENVRNSKTPTALPRFNHQSNIVFDFNHLFKLEALQNLNILVEKDSERKLEHKIQLLMTK